MALRNGLLVHGPTHWAAAIRTNDGELKVASGRKPTFGQTFDRMPGVRGVVRLGEAFAVIPLVKRALPQAKLPMQDARTAGAMLGAAVATHALRRSGPRTFARETGIALISLAPAMLALRQGELASYHGVEHKAIAAYEQDGETVDAEKEHDRCGSNLVAPMLAATAAGGVAARKAGLRGPAADGVVALGSMAFAVEVFGWSERHADSALAKALRRPGYEIQRLVGTREPSKDQIEVGQAALAEILRRESDE
jgi:uncharacterized protein YqhQ